MCQGLLWTEFSALVRMCLYPVRHVWSCYCSHIFKTWL